MEHRYITINDLRLHFVTAGTPGAPLVVLIHGFPEFWYSWRHQIERLAQDGFYVVALDMPGYGESECSKDVSRYNQVALSDDVAALVSALGYDTFIPVGHDYGAPTAWHCALRFPERVPAVVGMSIPYGGRPPVSPSKGFKRLFERQFFYINYFQTPGVAEAELEANLEGFLRSFFYYSSGESGGQFDTSSSAADSSYLEALPDPKRLPEWLDETHFQKYVENFKRNGLHGPLNYYRNFDETWNKTEDLVERKIECPALFLSGEYDPVTKFGAENERMDQWVPRVQKVEIPNCGHWIQQEAPQKVTDRMLEFLNDFKCSDSA